MKPLIYALDVGYTEGPGAWAACVGIETWADAKPIEARLVYVENVDEYKPGEFYKRELPCLMAALAAASQPKAVIIDGYAWLGSKKGLGAHLWEALGGVCPVVGVAKTPYVDSLALPVQRAGLSARPLWVSAAGMNPEDAAMLVRTMHGPHRIPTILSKVDALSRVLF